MAGHKSYNSVKVGGFFPRLAQCRQISIFAMQVAFTGKYWQIPVNTGKYDLQPWMVSSKTGWLSMLKGTLHAKQGPSLSIFATSKIKLVTKKSNG